jgi:membrane protease YdiL (CAAX protease family)
MKNIINWKLFIILLSASIISIIAVLPYAFTLAGDIVNQVPLPLPLLILVSVIQSSILFAVIIFFGLILSKKVGLGLPIIEDFLTKKKTQLDIKSITKDSVLFGFAVGIVIILVDLAFIKSSGNINLWSGQMPPAWMGFFASFYGGISEELLLRLFFMTFIIWIFSKFKKSHVNILNNNLIIWSAIIITAIVFGLGHLPITESVTVLTPLVIIRAIMLNSIGGIIFGWLYWKKGLESAIIAHFSADIVLHTIFPIFLFLV